MNRKTENGFSIVEIVIVLAVIVLVAAVGFFVFQRLGKSNRNIYFLRIDDGKVNLVESNIDKTGKTSVVVAGTGHEGINTEGVVTLHNEAILARPDWKYVAYIAQRDNDYPKLFIYDAKTKALATADSSKSKFEFVGWLDGKLIYVNSTIPEVNGLVGSTASAIKSYDPLTGKTVVILETPDTTSAGADSNAFNSFGGAYIIDGKLIYSYNTNKSSSLLSVNADGTSPNTLLEIPSTGPYSAGTFTNNIYAPKSLYFTFYGEGGKSNQSYIYTNGKLDKTTDELANQQPYNFYIASPDANKTAWYQKDGDNNQIYIGDANAQNGKVVGTFPRGIEPYAWYGNTLIVSKDGNTLYKLNTSNGKLTEIASYTHSPKGYNNGMAGYPGATYGYAGIFDY